MLIIYMLCYSCKWSPQNCLSPYSIDTDSDEHMDKFQVFFKFCGSSVLAEQSDVSVAATATQLTQGPIDIEKLKALLERKGARVLADYEASGMLSETSRKLLVKIGVSDLIERNGFYPATDDKTRLARCVVTLFPSLRVRMEDENEGFIGTSISSLLDNQNPPARQPNLVCIGQPNTTAQYIIIAENDKVAIPLQDNGLTYAIDKLFKMFSICNTVYPAQLTSVFHFFESVYEVPLSSGKRAKVVELISKLQAMQ
ncbi:uncharacterized protein LOC134064002 isoform X1 [Sardina pilchardus]|uniref:uncharacterized protein LOC134064002 isoform X1 n=1 Tax=Sardina pilchardus TaxID=27697 RepID=UPI002E144640